MVATGSRGRGRERREEKDELVRLTIRVAKSVPELIKRAAAEQGQSFHEWMRQVIYRALRNAEAGYGGADALKRRGGPGTLGDEYPYRGHGGGQYRTNTERESMGGDSDPDTLGKPASPDA